MPVEFWSEISFYTILKEEEVIGTACHSRNITERKLAELERSKINNELTQRNKDLEQFSYIISHNLRAPVANILGATKRLNDPLLSKEKQNVLSEGLNESASKLDNVIKDLSHILQVKREINATKEKVRFSELVDDIKISIKNLIDKDNINIGYDFSEIEEILTLKSYLYSIFYNLISNSIKYRQQQVPGIIAIKSHRLNDTIELIFTDNGMGIDLQKRSEQVFGLYKRFHTDIEGKGMGLFMVKTQVETLGGKISIKSEIKKGTEIKIEFEI
jgi:signal transduction histidine kinase